MQWDIAFGVMPYGPEWRAHRRFFHQYFKQEALGEYLPVQMNETRLFLRRASDDPGELPQQIRLFVLSLR